MSAIPADAIKVKVEKGWVTLSGQVDWHYQSQAAVTAVRQLSGVVGVSNGVTLKPRVSTSGISDDITHALHRSWFFDPDNIKVTASGGDVRLAGTVTSWHDRQLAAEAAWASPGTVNVANDIVVV